MTTPVLRVDMGPLAATLLRTLPQADDKVRMTRALAASARAFWVSLAQSRLHTTARDYVQGIRDEIGDDVATISLEGLMPNMIEEGWSGGDMRDWMLHSAHAKMGKNGPYNVIPFGHGAPGGGGKNVGAPMPIDIHRAAKLLAPTLSRPGKVESKGGRTVAYGQRLTPGSRNVSEIAKGLLTQKRQPWHANSIYLGMIREGKQFSSGKTQTTGYKTFRTISMNSNEPGKHWYHPGIKPRHFAHEVVSHMESIAADIILATLRDQSSRGGR